MLPAQYGLILETLPIMFGTLHNWGVLLNREVLGSPDLGTWTLRACGKYRPRHGSSILPIKFAMARCAGGLHIMAVLQYICQGYT